MPFTWVDDPHKAPVSSGAFSHAAGDPPLAQLRLWPHQSLTPRGFAWFIGLTCALLLLPALAAIGSPVLWGLLPFLLAAVGLIWWALSASWKSREILEELLVWKDHMSIRHREPRGKTLEWSANPHWVTVSLHVTGGPVANYLTLRGGGREVELGAFLSEDERVALYGELKDFMARLT